MKLANVKRLDRGDFPADLRDKIDPLLQPLNQFMEQVTQAIGGKLVDGENLLSVENTQKLTHNVAFSMANPLGNVRPREVRPRRAADATTGAQLIVTGFGWQILQSGQISVTVQFSGGSGTGSVALLFVGG